MLFAGLYPFTVSVWNFFPPGSEVKLNVAFSYHICYSDAANYDFRVINNKTNSPYKIDPGMSLAFPMYFGDETLVISILSGNIPGNYLLTAGDTALCLPDTALGVPQPGSYRDKEIIGDETYYEGGTWAINQANKTWQLTIKKIIPDPQSDDVTVGPGTPG